jgi:tetratricopeptide (TPR) repeat protein
MMILKHSICSLLLVVFLAAPIQADELTRAFLDGAKNYDAGNYDAAIAEFSKIIAAGIKNGKLFYNIGNAYLKSGDLGNAMLWYERALKMRPNDPDLRFNHQYALTLVKDAKEDNRGPILKVLFFWQHFLSAATVQWMALILNLLFWLILATQALRHKRTLQLTRYVVMVLAVVFILTTFYNHYTSSYVKHAVILADKISVRSGLTQDSTELFVLHAGSKVKIDKDNKDFYRIYFSDGKIGWVGKSDVGVI